MTELIADVKEWERRMIKTFILQSNTLETASISASVAQIFYLYII
jgi:hypothetical protein